MGVQVLQTIGADFSDIIEKWFDGNNNNPKIKANNINETLQFLFDTYPVTNNVKIEEATLFI